MTLPHFLKVVPLLQCGPSASGRHAGAKKTMCVYASSRTGTERNLPGFLVFIFACGFSYVTVHVGVWNVFISLIPVLR